MEWLAILAAPLGQPFIRWPVLYIFANASHILSLAMLIGTVAILDLRLLGAFARLPLPETAALLSRIAVVALGFAVLTGTLLFSVKPHDYLANTAFLAKLGLVLIATLNAALIRRSKGWAAMRSGAPPTPTLRLGAVLSLVAWITALLAGRWIGFL